MRSSSGRKPIAVCAFLVGLSADALQKVLVGAIDGLRDSGQQKGGMGQPISSINGRGAACLEGRYLVSTEGPRIGNHEENERDTHRTLHLLFPLPSHPLRRCHNHDSSLSHSTPVRGGAVAVSPPFHPRFHRRSYSRRNRRPHAARHWSFRGFHRMGVLESKGKNHWKCQWSMRCHAPEDWDVICRCLP